MWKELCPDIKQKIEIRHVCVPISETCRARGPYMHSLVHTSFQSASFELESLKELCPNIKQKIEICHVCVPISETCRARGPYMHSLVHTSFQSASFELESLPWGYGFEPQQSRKELSRAVIFTDN